MLRCCVPILMSVSVMPASANLVVNGDFEQGWLAWTPTDCNLIEEEGNHYVELYGDSALLESTFISEPNQEYMLTIDAKGDGSRFTVLMGDTVSFPTSGEWETFSYQIGNEYSNQLMIMIGDTGAPPPPDASVFIDNVSLVREPFPIPTMTTDAPPHDARQDFSPFYWVDQGVDQIRATFSCEVRDAFTHGPLDSNSFELTDTAGTAPEIDSVTPVSSTTYDIVFSGPITPGEWTTFRAFVENPDGVPANPETDTRIDIGFLPGDADGDGTSAPADILALVDNLTGVVPLPIGQADIDRDSWVGPADVLRLVDLLNGVHTSRVWLDAQLPERP